LGCDGHFGSGAFISEFETDGTVGPRGIHPANKPILTFLPNIKAFDQILLCVNFSENLILFGPNAARRGVLEIPIDEIICSHQIAWGIRATIPCRNDSPEACLALLRIALQQIPIFTNGIIGCPLKRIWVFEASLRNTCGPFEIKTQVGRMLMSDSFRNPASPMTASAYVDPIP
jgi:hypothetical protein